MFFNNGAVPNRIVCIYVSYKIIAPFSDLLLELLIVP